MSAVCPIHRIRQLSKSGYCCDCGIIWLESVVNGAELKASWYKSDYDEDVRRAEEKYQAKMGQMGKEAKEANARLTELNNNNKSEEKIQ